MWFWKGRGRDQTVALVHLPDLPHVPPASDHVEVEFVPHTHRRDLGPGKSRERAEAESVDCEHDAVDDGAEQGEQEEGDGSERHGEMRFLRFDSVWET